MPWYSHSFSPVFYIYCFHSSAFDVFSVDLKVPETICRCLNHLILDYTGIYLFLRCLNFHPSLVTIGYVLKHEYFMLTVPLVLINHQLCNSMKRLLQYHYQKRFFHLTIIDEPYLDNHTTPLIAQFLPVKNGI